MDRALHEQKKQISRSRLSARWRALDLAHPRPEILASVANASVNCMRLIDFLEIEHLQHGGKENGSLLAPYSQLVYFGITRRLIAGAIREAERSGLLRVERGGKKGTTMTESNRYRLTYQWSTTRIDGLWNWQPPTDEWKQFGLAQ